MTTATKTQISTHIRWMVRKDMPEVLAIEQACFEWPWQEDDFIRCLRQRNAIGMVCEVANRIVGFNVYELHKHRLFIYDFAVHEDFRFKGVGRAMVTKLVTKLSHDRRSQIAINVRERNLDGQLFLKAMGFKCVGVIHDFYDDSPEDALDFRYRYRGDQCE